VLKVFFLIFLIFQPSCQPTNTTIGKRTSASSGTLNNTTLQQVRITDAAGAKLVGTDTTMAVGATLSLKSKLFTLADTFVDDVSVRWTLRSISGNISGGLSCGAQLSASCDFTPTAPGSVYIEAVLLDRSSNIIAYTDATHPIIVTAPNSASVLEITSGNNQNGTVNTNLTLPLTVTVKDSFNRGVAGEAISFSVNSGAATLLSSSPSITDYNGVATATIQLGTTAGALTISATVVSQNTLTQNFSATAYPGAPVAFEFLTPPTATYAQLPLTQGPVVVAKDSFGNIVTTLNAPIAVSVQTGSGSLTGNTTKNFINGVVSFVDLAYSMVENNVVIRFSGSGLHLDSSPLNFITPTGVSGMTPADVDFGFVVTQGTGALGRSTSSEVTLSGLSQVISASIDGVGTTARLRLNGGPEQTFLSDLNNGDKIRVVADAPDTAGSVNVITLHLGGRDETFEVRTVDPNSVAYMFVSESAPGGSSIGNFAPTCTTEASNLGYVGSWVAPAALSNISLKNAMPYQWGKLKRVDGLTIASSWDQLWSGPLTNPINLKINLGVNNTRVWTGVNNLSLTTGTASSNCSNFSGVDNTGVTGLSSSTTNSWYQGSTHSCGGNSSVYCVSVPTGPQDTTPFSVTFTETITTAPLARTTSNAVTVRGVTTYITASVTGVDGNPKLKINGGAEVTSGMVGNGDQIELVMNAPAITGQKNTATLSLGPLSTDWWVGLADANKTAAVFVTSTTYSGNLGGLHGANAKCQTQASAAGLSGTWIALLSIPNGEIRKSMPWNWGRLRRLDGATVANSLADLWDGQIQNPINITENQVNKSTLVWTGIPIDYYSRNCGDFSIGTASSTSYSGNSDLTSAWVTSNGSNCSNLLSLYCMSDPSSGSDTEPLPIAIPMKVTYTSGEVVDFNEVTVTGISDPITVTLVGTQGTPVLSINGVPAPGNTATVNFGDKIKVTMTASTTLGEKYSSTLYYGPTQQYTLQLGYADSSAVARVFISSQNLSFNGIAGLNASCTDAADNGGLGGSWVAMVAAEPVALRDRIPWNWGQLKLVDNTTVVANNWTDLWDGSLNAPINTDEFLNILSTTAIATGSNPDGSLPNGFGGTGFSGSVTYNTGNSGTMTNKWISNSTNSASNAHIYCIEDRSGPVDTVPTSFEFNYKIYQTVSSRIESAPVTIKGITAPVAVVITGTQGNPAFKLDGGAEVTTGSISNGQTLTLVMDSPANLLESHKMEVKVGTGTTVPWRVWTGNPSNSNVKRVFMASSNGMFVGVLGGDLACQNAANAQTLGGTWKAIISGNIESEYAINRIGYDWGQLKLVDNTVVTTQPADFWNTDVVPLTNGINRDASGTLQHAKRIYSGTKSNGKLDDSDPSSNCTNWTVSSATVRFGLSGSTGVDWIYNNTAATTCNVAQYIYCIEQ
jgi:hypothetical protein